MATVGIKETMEILDGIEVLAGIVNAVIADGKVTVSDISQLTPLVTQFTKLKEAVKDAKLAIDELKDLDADEVSNLVGKVKEIINVFID